MWDGSMSDRSTIEVRLCDADIDLIVERLAAKLAQSAPGASDDDGALTVAQAAQFVQCSESHLDGLRSRGGGPKFTRIGGRRIRYFRSDLLSWMRKNAALNSAKS